MGDEPQASATTGIDNAALFGKFQAGEDAKSKMRAWRDRVHERGVLKALNLSDEEDMGDFNIDQSHKIQATNLYLGGKKPAAAAAGGLGTLAKTAILAGTLATGVGLPFAIPAGFSLLKDMFAAPIVPDRPQPPAADTDTWNDLNFWPPKESGP